MDHSPVYNLGKEDQEKYSAMLDKMAKIISDAGIKYTILEEQTHPLGWGGHKIYARIMYGLRGISEMILYRITIRSADPLQALMIAAHEYGHHRSFHEGHSPAEMPGAYANREKNLTAEQARLIMDEEHRAWNIGKAELQKLGFDRWAEFEKYKQDCLTTYRVGFIEKGLGLIA